MKNKRIKPSFSRRCDFCGSGLKQNVPVATTSNGDTAICLECVFVAQKMLHPEGLVPDIEFTYLDRPPKDQ